MSVAASLGAWREVVDAAEPDPLLRLVLLGLACHSGSDGSSRPSVARLAQLTSLSVRTVRGRLRVAEEAGLVEVDGLAGGRGRTPIRRPGKAARRGAAFVEAKGGTTGPERRHEEAVKAAPHARAGGLGTEKEREKRAREAGPPLGGGPSRRGGDLAPINDTRLRALLGDRVELGDAAGEVEP